MWCLPSGSHHILFNIMKQLLIICSLSTTLAFSQKIVVVDKNSKAPLPYTAIKTKDGGFYTEENGRFILPKDNDSISISHLGYHELKVSLFNIKDTLFLTPSPLHLDEVVVTNKKTSLVKIEPLKMDRYFSSLPLKPKREIIISLKPNAKNEGLYIRNIVFPLGKIKHFNKTDTLYKNAVGVFRLNIYINNHDGLPKQAVFTSEPIEFIMSKKEKITIDISQENVQFPQEGLSFGLEMIGRLDDAGNASKENSYIRPKITSQSLKGFEANTYLRSLFSKDPGFYNINVRNETLSRDFKRHKTSRYNLNIGITLSSAKK